MWASAGAAEGQAAAARSRADVALASDIVLLGRGLECGRVRVRVRVSKTGARRQRRKTAPESALTLPSCLFFVSPSKLPHHGAFFPLSPAVPHAARCSRPHWRTPWDGGPGDVCLPWRRSCLKRGHSACESRRRRRPKLLAVSRPPARALPRLLPAIHSLQRSLTAALDAGVPSRALSVQRGPSPRGKRARSRAPHRSRPCASERKRRPGPGVRRRPCPPTPVCAQTAPAY